MEFLAKDDVILIFDICELFYWRKENKILFLPIILVKYRLVYIETSFQQKTVTIQSSTAFHFINVINYLLSINRDDLFTISRSQYQTIIVKHAYKLFEPTLHTLTQLCLVLLPYGLSYNFAIIKSNQQYAVQLGVCVMEQQTQV